MGAPVVRRHQVRIQIAGSGALVGEDQIDAAFVWTAGGVPREPDLGIDRPRTLGPDRIEQRHVRRRERKARREALRPAKSVAVDVGAQARDRRRRADDVALAHLKDLAAGSDRDVSERAAVGVRHVLCSVEAADVARPVDAGARGLEPPVVVPDQPQLTVAGGDRRLVDEPALAGRFPVDASNGGDAEAAA